MLTPLAKLSRPGGEAGFFLGYFVVYLGYLFIYQESEWAHWLSLVLLPLLFLYLLRKRYDPTVRGTLAAVGLRSDTWKNGLWWAIGLGLALSAAQLAVSDRSAEFMPLLRSGQALYLFPIALALLLLTAGFTEEFFFRGVIQTRLARWWQSKVKAVLATSVLFGMYHIPYAYLNSNWPSHGNWEAAISSAMGQGVVGGLILGTVYERSDRNLLASVLVHALINTLPAMTMIRFGAG